MRKPSRSDSRGFRFLVAFLSLIIGIRAAGQAGAEAVVMKNGTVYRGTLDRDNTLLWIYDGLKRVVVRDTKVERTQPDSSLQNLETFRIEQPLTKHGGAMPKEVVRVAASPWNDRGRRAFSFEGSRPGKVTKMEQAINYLGPYLVNIRGVDGFWLGQLATNQVPREIILGILANVDKTDRNERIRVARFLIQAKWYKEARAELDQIRENFRDDSELGERLDAAKSSIAQLEAAERFARIESCRSAQQFLERDRLLRSFPKEDVAAELSARVEELGRKLDAQAAADRALASELASLASELPPGLKAGWKAPVAEALLALKEVPDAVRGRFLAWQKVRDDGSLKPERKLALALSGYAASPDLATDDPESALTYWTMRDHVHDYLAATREEVRADLLAKLSEAKLKEDGDAPAEAVRADLVTHLALFMLPPLHDPDLLKAKGKPIPLRVRDDANPVPTEYLVTLPPEYHPLRRYPAVVALHDGAGPETAIAWWSAEASRRGYIVVAPEYRLPDRGKEYQYSPSEHASVELALRDARRRFSIDSDRVFVGGQLMGGNMAWDISMAHPDLFAGAVIVSGLPFKYVKRYLSHAETMPLYVVLGDLAPAANEVVFGQMLKPMITRAWDVTYAEYLKRGLEDFPEEVEAAVEWMDKRRREPLPKSFKAVTARSCDARFHGIVVREFQDGRTTAPEAVQPFGENLNPATIDMRSSSLSNLIDLRTSGIRGLDVWLSPQLVDFSRKMEIRINGRKLTSKGPPQPSLSDLLEDLRLRGDLQQVFWLKVSAG